MLQAGQVQDDRDRMALERLVEFVGPFYEELVEPGGALYRAEPAFPRPEGEFYSTSVNVPLGEEHYTAEGDPRRHYFTTAGNYAGEATPGEQMELHQAMSCYGMRLNDPPMPSNMNRKYWTYDAPAAPPDAPPAQQTARPVPVNMRPEGWQYTGELTEQPDAPPPQPDATVKKLLPVSARGHAVKKCQIPDMLSIAQREQFYGMQPGTLTGPDSSGEEDLGEQNPELPIQLPALQSMQPVAPPVRAGGPFLKGARVNELLSDEHKERYYGVPPGTLTGLIFYEGIVAQNQLGFAPGLSGLTPEEREHIHNILTRENAGTPASDGGTGSARSQGSRGSLADLEEFGTLEDITNQEPTGSPAPLHLFEDTAYEGDADELAAAIAISLSSDTGDESRERQAAELEQASVEPIAATPAATPTPTAIPRAISPPPPVPARRSARLRTPAPAGPAAGMSAEEDARRNIEETSELLPESTLPPAMRKPAARQASSIDLTRSDSSVPLSPSTSGALLAQVPVGTLPESTDLLALSTNASVAVEPPQPSAPQSEHETRDMEMLAWSRS